MESKFMWFVSGKYIDIEGLSLLVEKIYQITVMQMLPKICLDNG